jgi:formylglycine-generating enzyme required for sulfatase activity
VAWATNAPPDYMVVDLVVKKGARTYYIDPLQLPDGGVTNRKYKTDYLVMRRIPAKDAIFPMGYYSDAEYQYCLYHRVKLTNDFYMAVYELTLGQMKNAIGESPDNLVTYYNYGSFPAEYKAYSGNLANPLPETPYYRFRGFGAGSTWGGTFNHEIADSGSYLYQLRNALNLPTLDLPTDAEWDFACRAGTDANRYDGTWNYSDSADAIAWTANNSSSFALWGYAYYLPHEVGLLQPNAFGLYDMLGNVSEMCLDLYNEGTAYTKDAVINDMNAEPIVAPTGPATDIKGNYDGLSRGSYSSYAKGGLWDEWKSTEGDPNSTRRVLRGGSVSYTGWGIMAYYRFAIGSSKCMTESADHDYDTRGPYGCRLVCLP